jgi:hypothetical protein
MSRVDAGATTAILANFALYKRLIHLAVVLHISSLHVPLHAAKGVCLVTDCC